MSESPRAGTSEARDWTAPGYAEREILGRLARGEPLPACLSGILEFIAHGNGSGACAIWLLDGDSKLRAGAQRGLPDELLREFDGASVGDDLASCGAAASRRERFSVSDVEAHPNWHEHRGAMLTYGFNACWSTPILSPGGPVLGTLAVYSKEKRLPSPDECARFDVAVHMAALGLARVRADCDRAALDAHLQEMEPLQALGRLASGIAHDFNNILTAISGHTHLALLEMEEERSVHESLIAIQEASVRAAEVVRRILMFRRPRAPEKTRTELAPIVKDAVALLRSALPTAIAIDSRADATTPPIYADPAQLHQVILNLCTHAARTIGEHGRLSLEIETAPPGHEDLVSLGAAASLRYARLSIKDDGPGLESSVRQRILEPLAVALSRGERSGLELATAHAIIKAHDGLMAVHSRPGEGTDLRIYLPEAAAAESQPAPAQSEKLERRPTVAGKPVRVMYVDDEEPLVALAVRWLGRLGYEVTGFSDSILALEAFRSRPTDFDAVISDFSMPGLSGLELVREVRSIRPDTIVVMSSGYVRPEDTERAQALGAVEVVLKPQGMAEFGRILHRILSQRSP